MKIASFNVQRFGLTKVSDPDVLSTLVKIVSRYDIILILEVVDVSGVSVERFMTELNRNDVVDLIDSYQYQDNQVDDLDAFAREPYILYFKPQNTVLADIVLIPVHTRPWDSRKELDELYEVFLKVKDKWKTDNVMILGDFNADGAYVSDRDMKEIRIRTDGDFHWLIGDGVDTTTRTGNEHTYDRHDCGTVYGRDMLEAIIPDSAKPFNFQMEFGLTEDIALRVSDHYPVEVELRSASLSCIMHHTATSPDRPDKGLKETLKIDIMQLKKENLLLEREKLKLEIALLKQKLADLKLDKY